MAGSDGRSGRPVAVVSMCGTSVLTNGADDHLRRLLTRIANDTEPPHGQRERLEVWCDQRARELAAADDASAARLSAEANTLIRLASEQSGYFDRGTTLWFIHTDTWVGARAAGVVAGWARRRFPDCAVQVHRIDSLRTSSLMEFQSGIGALARWIIDDLQGIHLVANLTGGFKSVQGVLQTMVTLRGGEAWYVFEGPGSELLNIPRLPVTLDLPPEAECQLRLLCAVNPLPPAEVADVPGALRMDGEEVYPNPWGELVGAELLEWLARSPVLPEPPHPGLVICPECTRVAAWYAGAEPTDRAAFNQLVDQLVAVLVRHGADLAAVEQHMKGARPKKLKGVDGRQVYVARGGRSQKPIRALIDTLDGDLHIIWVGAHQSEQEERVAARVARRRWEEHHLR